MVALHGTTLIQALPIWHIYAARPVGARLGVFLPPPLSCDLGLVPVPALGYPNLPGIQACLVALFKLSRCLAQRGRMAQHLHPGCLPSPQEH